MTVSRGAPPSESTVETVVEPTPPSRLLAITLPVFGLVISLCVLEVAFRFLMPVSKRDSWRDRPTDYFLPSNAASLQDELPHTKDPGVYRITVVGDSFTFGPYLQLEDTFPKRLEHFLNLDPSAQRVEVLNRGVSGSATTDQVAIVEKAIAAGANVVVLEITLNDAEPHSLTADERKTLFEDPLQVSNRFAWWKSLRFLLSRIHNSQTVSRYIEYHTRFFREPETFKRFDDALARMSRAAQRAQVPLVAVVFPLFDFRIDERYPFKESHEIVGRALASHQIPMLDLRGAYRNIPPERLQVIPAVDNHPNEIAHRIAAEHLLAFLATNQLVPEAVLPKRVFAERKHLRSHSEKPRQAWSHLMRHVKPKVEEKEG